MPSKMKTRCDICSKKCTNKIQLSWTKVTYMGQEQIGDDVKSFCSNKCKIGFIRTDQRKFLQYDKDFWLDIVEQTKNCFRLFLVKNIKRDDGKIITDYYKIQIKYGSLLVEYVDDCFSLKKTEYELYEKYCKIKALSLDLIEYASIQEEDQLLNCICRHIKLLEKTWDSWGVDTE